MGKKQRTIHTLEELKDWIENNPSEETGLMAEDRKIYVKNHQEKIIVPIDLWAEAPLRPGGKFDRRMWRWGKEAPRPLYVHPEVLTSTLVYPIRHHEMATYLKDQNGCTVALGELL